MPAADDDVHLATGRGRNIERDGPLVLRERSRGDLGDGLRPDVLTRRVVERCRSCGNRLLSVEFETVVDRHGCGIALPIDADVVSVELADHVSRRGVIPAAIGRPVRHRTDRHEDDTGRRQGDKQLDLPGLASRTFHERTPF